MRRSQSTLWIAGTLCVVGLITAAGARGAQQADEKSDTNKTQTDEPQTENAQTEQTQEPRNSAADPSGRTPAQQEPIMLGVRIAASSTTGVYVQEVMPQSPADRSGIRPQDYVLSIDGQTIASPQEFDDALRQIQPGDEAEFIVWRNRQKQTLPVKFDEGQRVARHPDDTQFNSQRGQQPQADDKVTQAAWLGVQFGAVRADDASETDGKSPQGVLITGVYPSGPAARAGIYCGDIVTQVDGKEVTSPDQFVTLIGNHKPNDTVTLTLTGADGESTATATLGDRDGFAVGMLQPPQPEGGTYAGDYMDDDVSDHAMMLEQHRHFAAQHQRIEDRLEEVLNEVRSLRKELDKSKQQQ